MLAFVSEYFTGLQCFFVEVDGVIFFIAETEKGHAKHFLFGGQQQMDFVVISDAGIVTGFYQQEPAGQFAAGAVFMQGAGKLIKQLRAAPVVQA